MLTYGLFCAIREAFYRDAPEWECFLDFCADLFGVLFCTFIFLFSVPLDIILSPIYLLAALVYLIVKIIKKKRG